ncbi:MAG: acetolactate synthase small subunit, partial [Clostridia bacterium]|nr:acetolactate synthase small subunit [Clostridia bacterium]
RSDIMTAVDIFRASVIDYSNDGMCIEVTGNPSKIDAFVKLMQPFGILEMCRTGIVALDRGNKTLFTE